MSNTLYVKVMVEYDQMAKERKNLGKNIKYGYLLSGILKHCILYF